MKVKKIYACIATYGFGCLLVRYQVNSSIFNLVSGKDFEYSPRPEIWSQMFNAIFVLLEPVGHCLQLYLCVAWCIVLPLMLIWILVEKISELVKSK